MKDELHGSNNASENDNLVSGEIRKGEQLLKRIPVKYAPFVKMWTEDRGWWAVAGKYAITENFDSEEELDEYLQSKPWDLIITLINIIIIEGGKILREEETEK